MGELAFRVHKLISGISLYEPQKEFFNSDAKRTAYGGARGGGKSYAMRLKFICLALRYPGIQMLLLRRSLPELRENHILPMKRLLYGIAKYTDSSKEFRFPNGARIKLGYFCDDGDALQYQGQAYEVIGMEEATQFTEFQYSVMTEINRLSGNMKERFSPRMYFTCNPGGIGHAWVKRLFIDRKYRQCENPDDYKFIKSTVFDNTYLMENDRDYVTSLESLPEMRRRAMLLGDWDAFEGQYFTEFDRSIHVCEPFEIPESWTRFASLDYGLDMTAFLWFAYPADLSRLICYREFYRPDLILSEAAKKIAEYSDGDNLKYIAASPDLAGRRQDSGVTGFDIMRGNGLKSLIPAENARIAGWRRVREFLAHSEKPPTLMIFSCCVNLIRTLPSLRFDEVRTEDAATSPHELTHAPDALRYGLMTLPFFRTKTKEAEKLTTYTDFLPENKNDIGRYIDI